jgi:hypothetical protein
MEQIRQAHLKNLAGSTSSNACAGACSRQLAACGLAVASILGVDWVALSGCSLGEGERYWVLHGTRLVLGFGCRLVVVPEPARHWAAG